MAGRFFMCYIRSPVGYALGAGHSRRDDRACWFWNLRGVRCATLLVALAGCEAAGPGIAQGPGIAKTPSEAVFADASEVDGGKSDEAGPKADRWFEPLPKSEWEEFVVTMLRGYSTAFDYRPVVVVMAWFGEGKGCQLGNGVFLSSVRGWRKSGPAVLTCARLLEREGEIAQEVRVGAFDHSFYDPRAASAAFGEYAEFSAEIARIDVDLDLALLAVACSGDVYGVEEFDVEPRTAPLTIIAIAPWRQPRELRSVGPMIGGGYVGAPIFFEDHRPIGIVRGAYYESGPAVWASARDVLRLLDTFAREDSGAAEPGG